MPQELIRRVLTVIWLFIFTFWMATSRGKNVTNFFHSFTNIRSTSIVLFEIICFYQVLLPVNTTIPLGSWNTLLGVSGIILTIGGAGLASWAKLVMGKSWGRPAQHDKKVQSALVTSGPFVFSRNPLCLGLLVLFIRQQIALHSYFILLSPLFFLAIKMAVSAEEKLLVAHFGKSYTAYQSRVSRFFSLDNIRILL